MLLVRHVVMPDGVRALPPPPAPAPMGQLTALHHDCRALGKRIDGLSIGTGEQLEAIDQAKRPQWRRGRGCRSSRCSRRAAASGAFAYPFTLRRHSVSRNSV